MPDNPQGKLTSPTPDGNVVTDRCQTPLVTLNPLNLNWDFRHPPDPDWDLETRTNPEIRGEFPETSCDSRRKGRCLRSTSSTTRHSPSTLTALPLSTPPRSHTRCLTPAVPSPTLPLSRLPFESLTEIKTHFCRGGDQGVEYACVGEQVRTILKEWFVRNN